VTRQDPTSSPAFPAHLRRAGRLALLAGLGGIVLCGVLWVLVIAMPARWPDGQAAFYKGYLVAWFFFLGMSLGAMTAVMVHHLVGGEWGYYVRRFAEAAANVLPL
jgi:hypothetical protein